MRVGLIQYSPEWENRESNIEKLNELMQKGYGKEELIIFPEMSLTGFTMESSNYAEEFDGTSFQYFMELAQKFKCHVIAGVIERSEDKIFNTLLHFDKKGLLIARYRKIHPFSFAKEDQYYSAGNEKLVTKIEGNSVGLSICYDLRFPELYRLYGKERTKFIINIANWPVKRIEHWKALLRARAIENQCFMIGVNRVGNDPFNEYNGCSAVYNPMGESVVIVENEEKLISTELNLEMVEEIRQKLPFLNDIKLI